MIDAYQVLPYGLALLAVSRIFIDIYEMTWI